jgi:hypothetical protein
MLKKFDLDAIQKLMLDTVPARDQMRKWGEYEKYGCEKLWGASIMEIKQFGQTTTEFFTIINELSRNNYWIPLVSHSYEMMRNLQNYFSNECVYTVLLDTIPEFIDVAIKRKWPSDYHCLDLDSYSKFLNSTKQLHFDHVIPSWNPCDRSQYHKLITLAEKIGLDMNIDSSEEFINKYIQIHI